MTRFLRVSESPFHPHWTRFPDYSLTPHFRAGRPWARRQQLERRLLARLGT